MKTFSLALILAAAASLLVTPSLVLAQAATPAKSAAATPSQPPADPWPRVVDLSNGAQVLVYQPQVNKWTDNRIDFRAALAIKPTGAKDETFGVIFATRAHAGRQGARARSCSRTSGSRRSTSRRCRTTVQRTRPSCRRNSRQVVRTIALDRLESSLALAGIKPPTVAGAEQSAAGHRQLFAGDPGADRRRAGVEAGARPQPRSSASSTRAR